MKLLLVEDDVTTVEAVKLCLMIYKKDYFLSVSGNGSEAMRLFKTEPFDGLILDLGLPDLDGMVVLAEVNRFSSLPVIVLTARYNEKDRTKALELGAKDYILKPYNFHHLLKSMGEHFEKSGRSGETR